MPCRVAVFIVPHQEHDIAGARGRGERDGKKDKKPGLKFYTAYQVHEILVLGQSMRVHRFLNVHKMLLVPILWLFVVQ
jgi:hypothetical protein